MFSTAASAFESEEMLFAWVDGDCHHEFGQFFNNMDKLLPVVIAYLPTERSFVVGKKIGWNPREIKNFIMNIVDD